GAGAAALGSACASSEGSRRASHPALSVTLTGWRRSYRPQNPILPNRTPRFRPRPIGCD
ncbi:hypothetical protein M9458_017130, partial [Cirrhinus mrigala]